MTFSTTATVPNPSLTSPLPPNYQTTVPVTKTSAAAQGRRLESTSGCACGGRRNLFAPVSINNPMVVVDSMRFPMVDGTAPATGTSMDGVSVPKTATGSVAATGGNYIYSVQRYQPYRGGHAVPVPYPGGGTPPTGSIAPVDPRYGYTEQIVVPVKRCGRAREGSICGTRRNVGVTTTIRRQDLLRDSADLSHAGLGERIRAGVVKSPGGAVGLLPVQRPGFHECGRAAAGAGLFAGAVHEAVRGICRRGGECDDDLRAVTPTSVRRAGAVSSTIVRAAAHDQHDADRGRQSGVDRRRSAR